jgi:hypothetical protein
LEDTGLFTDASAVRAMNAALPVHPTVRAAFAISANAIQLEDGRGYFTLTEVQVGLQEELLSTHSTTRPRRTSSGSEFSSIPLTGSIAFTSK